MAAAKTKKGSAAAKKPKNLSPKGGAVKGGKQKSWNPANF